MLGNEITTAYVYSVFQVSYFGRIYMLFHQFVFYIVGENSQTILFADSFGSRSDESSMEGQQELANFYTLCFRMR